MFADRTTQWMVMEGEIVLIHVNATPTYFARVDRIEPDVKEGWWKLELLLLEMPIERITWVIREDHMAGAPFMIGETLLRIDQVPPLDCEGKQQREEETKETRPVRHSAKIIPFPYRRRPTAHA